MQDLDFTGSPLVGASIGEGLQALKDFQTLKLGNVVLCSLPDSRDEAAAVLDYCRKNGIYIMLSELVRRYDHTRWHAKSLDKKTLEELLPLAGKYFLGRYAVGEVGGILYWPKYYTIDEGVGSYRNMPPAENDAEAHQNYIEYLKKELAFERKEICDCKLFNVDSSVVFATHAEAGIDGQCLEMMPGDPLITLSAIRGTARAEDQNWGVHIAQMYYGGIHCDEMYMHRWRASLWLSFMAGAQFIYPECGHYRYRISDEPERGFDDPMIRQFREELRELYRFSIIHRRPAGFPESTMAIVRGADDGHPGIWNPYAWGVYESGEAWEYSDAEKAWELYKTFYTRCPFFDQYNTGRYDLSGNPPGGQLDMIPVNGDFSAYKTLVFLGTNRMDEELYAKLINFVKNGGHLLIALSHFDQSPVRGGEMHYFRNGRIRELCGFDIDGTGESDVYGISIIRQCTDPRYDLAVKNPRRDPNFNGRVTAMKLSGLTAQTTILAGMHNCAQKENQIAEIDSRPLLVEHRLGKGLVLTLTAGEAPGSFGLREFVNSILWSALRVHRTEIDFITGDRVRYAVYKENEGCRKFYLYNCDPDVSCGVQILRNGKKHGEILLAANEFKAGFLSDEMIFIPQDHLWDAESDGKDQFRFITQSQKICIINTGSENRQITINGQKISVAPGAREELDVPAYIPEEKAEFFSPDFMIEPAIVPSDLSTPY